jgi:flagellar motor component MotA
MWFACGCILVGRRSHGGGIGLVLSVESIIVIVLAK